MADLLQAATWHRQVAALIAAADRAGVAAAEVPRLRDRLASQEAGLTQIASRAGEPLPALQPSPGEIAAAAPGLGDLTTAAVARAVRTAESTLDATDDLLRVLMAPAGPRQPPAATGPAVASPVGVPSSGPSATPRAAPATAWPAGARNALVYGAAALVVLALQALAFLAFSETALPLLAPLCLLVLPAFAWGTGYLVVGLIYRPQPGGPAVKRTPRLGAVICLIPDLLLCAGVGVLVILRALNPQ